MIPAMLPMTLSSVYASNGTPSVSRPLPPPLPLPPNRFRKDPRLATFYEHDIAPVWTEPFGRLLLSQLSPSGLGKATVLDVMCHTGYPGLDILRRCPSARLVAIDPSAALIGLARDKAGPLVGRRVFFRTEAAEPTLPFDESVYDLVFSNLGLHDTLQPWALLREMTRVAKPGAAVLATLPLRGSFGEFYALLGALIDGRAPEAAKLEAHLATWPDAATICGWAAEAGLEDIAVVTEPFSILLAGGPDLFFAPVIEYGPLSAWKAILGDRGPEMQAAFNQLRDSIDDTCQGSLPFVLTIRAACLQARKPRPRAQPSFEEDPENAPTRPGG
jgi:SAM-dependent methyltransferase